MRNQQDFDHLQSIIQASPIPGQPPQPMLVEIPNEAMPQDLAQAQAQQNPQQAIPQVQQQLMTRRAISDRAHQIYLHEIPQFQAQYPRGIREEVHPNLRQQCLQTATVQITEQMNMLQIRRQQIMAAT
jgi:hypothetical protein